MHFERETGARSGRAALVVSWLVLGAYGCGAAPAPEPREAPTDVAAAPEPELVAEAAVEEPEAQEPDGLGYALTELERAPAAASAEDAVRDAEPLEGFESAAELRAYFEPSLREMRAQVLRDRAEERRWERRRSARVRASGGSIGLGDSSPRPSPSQASAPSAPSADSVTNTQVAGVDEGGIVKLLGEHLVVLRRGRLFTVRLGQSATELAPRSQIDVRAPGERYDAWYDEMLVHEPSRTVVVIGFSYGVEATELALFRVAADGRLTRHGRHHLRSNDYYSSRNYASRLVGDTLVLYTPHDFVQYGWPVRLHVPSMRSGDGSFRPILSEREVLRPQSSAPLETLHMVVTCDLSAQPLSCSARGMLGASSRSFFVSSGAVYVWVGASGGARASVYRLPLDGTAPSSMKVSGMPIDQFSFEESEGALRVLVSSSGRGDAMWSPEAPAGALALLQVPIASFAPGRESSTASPAYRPLPGPSERRSFQNRFVGDYLLYGTGAGWGRARRADSAELYLHHVSDGRSFNLALPHAIDRLEPMFPGAVAIGSDGAALHFTSVELGSSPRAVNAHVRSGATQGELRSHGFFYRPTSDSTGMLGLPVRGVAAPGLAHLVAGSASVLFLRVDALRFGPLGELAARETNANDACQVSCVDWYGNARPLFARDRIFGLLGYEIVEGHIVAGELRELARTSFHPRRER